MDEDTETDEDSLVMKFGNYLKRKNETDARVLEIDVIPVVASGFDSGPSWVLWIILLKKILSLYLPMHTPAPPEHQKEEQPAKPDVQGWC